MNKPQRKHPAHGVLIDPAQTLIVFDTVCTRHKAKWLSCDEVHQLLREVWQAASNWKLGRYVVMPDHVHYFAGADGESGDFDSWVRYWKSQFTKRFRSPDRRWQTDHWDTRIRNESAYEEKWEYVSRNAVRAGLVSHPDDWPYRGEIHELRWD